MQNLYLIGGRLNSSIYVEFIVFRAVAELKPFSFPNSFQRTDSLQFIISCLDRKIVIDFCFFDNERNDAPAAAPGWISKRLD